MPTNREKYFELIKKESKYLPKNVIIELLLEVNDFKSLQELYFHFDDEVKSLDILDGYIIDILKGKPYQYVLSRSYFLGREFYVDNNVLIPRQETEDLTLRAIKEIKAKYGDKNIKIADVCTGSGCIAISLKKELENAGIFAVDISKEACQIANKNSGLLDANIEVLEGNLLDPIIKKGVKLDVIISNPPYILDESTVAEETLKYEPHLALFASPNYKFYEEIFISSKLCLKEDGLMFFEIGEDMEDSLSTIARKYFPNKNIKFLKDIYNKTRFLFII